ncbi:MAG: winged helix-turn-helix transcriptional regulator [Candidatus Bathyarchaeota archaeon]|nr:MAG: winged helix-turn-helix transcriptional regulator [Candidatus Bathyarchaeota archaeon]
MALKLQLVEDGKVIFQIPLSPTDWSREELVNDLNAFEANVQRYLKLFSALSNETRLRMMKRLLERKKHTVTFTDFMQDLDLNPKLVWENTRKLREGGLLVKIGRNGYRCSEFGETSFMMMSLAFRRLINALEDMDDF